MPCPCKELEREHGDGGCKCGHYREAFPNCECEGCSVSDYSPRPVQPDEFLIRTVYSRVQINIDTGRIDPVHLRHDVRTRGLSVNRKPHISEQNLRAKIENKIARDREDGKERDGFYCVVTARCSAVRGLVDDDGKRLFCVYDTATEDDASHADICQAFELPPKTKDRRLLTKKLRRQLFERFVGRPTNLRMAYERNR